jgi:hypothetical protein
MQTTLQRELTQTNMSCVPDGDHTIEVIYNLVKGKYPEHCDNSVLCSDTCSHGANGQEWKHRVRSALATLKGKGRVHKTGLPRNIWRLRVKLDDKFILDACCGGRHFWFDKDHPSAVYMDIREEAPGHIVHQVNHSVEPDIIGDYRDMVFEDETFHLVLWDIPHKLKGDTGLITKKYGSLGTYWEDDCRRGFNEIWRILKPMGVLAFKYSDLDVKTSEMLAVFPETPLVGTITKKSANSTYWFIFMKLPYNGILGTD